MQPFVERQKPYECSGCPKSFKNSNGLKYHTDKMHGIDENRIGLFVSSKSKLNHTAYRERFSDDFRKTKISTECPSQRL